LVKVTGKKKRDFTSQTSLIAGFLPLLRISQRREQVERKKERWRKGGTPGR
jgi:hypothetical protein